MRVQVMSDLHMEFHRDHGAAFLEQLAENDMTSDKDVLVLAGDILSFEQAVKAEEYLAKFKAVTHGEVVYVPGNHEFYGWRPDSFLKHIRMAAKNTGVHLLYNEVATIAGKRFIGGTMWFRDPGARLRSKCGYRDFKIIQGFEPWVYEQNDEFLKLLDAELKPEDVVITHFMPFKESVHPKYEGDPGNAFFLCEVDRQLVETRRPDLWIHGHTHDACDYRIGSTRVVCNPLGYPNELDAQMAFNNRFLIEV